MHYYLYYQIKRTNDLLYEKCWKMLKNVKKCMHLNPLILMEILLFLFLVGPDDLNDGDFWLCILLLYYSVHLYDANFKLWWIKLTVKYMASNVQNESWTNVSFNYYSLSLSLSLHLKWTRNSFIWPITTCWQNIW